MSDIEKIVMSVIETLVITENTSELSDPAIKLSDIGFDSIMIVRFMLEVEEKLGFEFPADMVNADTFKSIWSVTNAIQCLSREGKV